MDFDDFSFNPDDFNEDAELTPVDEAKLDVVKAIRKYTDLVEENIKFKEKGEYKTNFRVLNRYICAMAELNELESSSVAMPVDEDDPEPHEQMETLTDEQILEKIEEIKRSVNEISISDLRQVEPDKEEGTELSLDDLGSIGQESDGDKDDGSLDF